MRRTKIVCTLGPASDTKAKVGELVRAGMNCARLNFSHGDHESHAAVAKLVREAAAEARTPMAILADMQGPKMRIGRFAKGPKVEGNQEIVSVTYASLATDVNPGDAIALDDGLIRLRVEAVEGDTVHTIVEDGGELSNNKGLNLPGVSISAPALTDKDRDDLAFAISVLEADYIALSFVRSADDVKEAKVLAGDVPIIAKIERPEAIAALTEIVDVADGIMIARGDLGVELGAEKVPLIQKRIIRETNAAGKVVITATQMLDSMIRNPRPTRAEAADVANAVMDGTDAVMLSGETAAGLYPVQTVEMMDAIIREVESDYVEDLAREVRELKSVGDEDWPFSNAAAREHRPRAPILAITSDVRVARRLALEWGVIPRLEVPPESLDETLRIATALLVREKLCQRGEAFAMVVGWPPSGRTNTLKLHRL
ncbi:MAG: pyruvate kinase [Deltaproteobacteria bacterium]|nr:pyruvate kinase [Deltaproteobacteria bacterium]